MHFHYTLFITRSTMLVLLPKGVFLSIAEIKDRLHFLLSEGFVNGIEVLQPHGLCLSPYRSHNRQFLALVNSF